MKKSPSLVLSLQKLFLQEVNGKALGLAVSVCHPEHARGVDAMATYCNISPRTSNFLQLKSVSDEQQKAPQAGSTESLIYPVKGKELFIEKGRNFTHVGVDQTFRRSLRGASTPWFCSIRYAHLRKTSTRRIRGSLRMTRRHSHLPPT